MSRTGPSRTTGEGQLCRITGR